VIHHGDCLEVMAGMPDASVDAIVTDPPYDLLTTSRNGSRRVNNPDTPAGRTGRGFMGKTWDGTGIAFRVETWAEALRVAKPGAHLLAFGGTRTYHRMAVAIEDAGWEIRDCLVWAYASGFPKSLNLDRDWKGWGTALKPAWEPIVMARKPLRGTVSTNVLTHGTGALNIDGTRIPLDAGEAPDGRDGEATASTRYGDKVHATPGRRIRGPQSDPRKREGVVGTDLGISNADVEKFQLAQRESTERMASLGRWPANVILTDPIFDGDVDGVVGGGEAAVGKMHSFHRNGPQREIYGKDALAGYQVSETYGDTGTYSRFFLIPKADRSDREPVLGGYVEASEHRTLSGGVSVAEGRTAVRGRPGLRENSHPTVKPTDLMRHLVRLVTPPGGRVLDPFLGSGTTALACEMEGFEWIGIEKEAEYVAIAEARLNGTQRGLGLSA
jgi:site-specific DNA-methyltransferase (adenine-specific)